jgi:putative ABC transport system permease protein
MDFVPVSESAGIGKMNLTRLASRNIAGSSFRSWVVAICAFLVAGFAIAILLILRGTENSLRLANDRLGADLIVVPEGTSTNVETALLMGNPTEVWMPENNLAKIAAIPGVAAASPQLYLSTLSNASCCSVPSMFLVAYDPETDLTIEPWLNKTIGRGLKLGEAVGGTHVFVPEGEQNIKIYGYFVTLKANIEPTGTGLDQSMFFTFETARDIARLSTELAVQPLVIPENSISSVMVRLEPGADPMTISADIIQQVPGVTPITSPNFFQAYRQQMNGLLASILLVLGITLILSALLIGLVFSMAANERRRELGVLRAMGATRNFVLRSLLLEASILALEGGLAGISFSVLVIFLFRNLLMRSFGFPFLLPNPGVLLVEALVGLAVALTCVTLAAMIPAYRISHLEPALAMRE